MELALKPSPKTWRIMIKRSQWAMRARTATFSGVHTHQAQAGFGSWY